MWYDAPEPERTIESVEGDLRGWKTFEATCQEDYEYACLRVRELTAELNWRRAGYKVQKRLTWGRSNDFIPCVIVYSFNAPEAERVAGVKTEGRHFYTKTPETGTSSAGFVQLWAC